MKNIHGGNIYDNKIDLDFSVNISPLGMPDKVKDVIVKSVDSINNYPDMECKDLKDKLGEKYGISPSFFLIGNGSSEIFMAIAHSKPGAKALIIVPSFYGYEYAFSNAGCDIEYYCLKEEDDYKLKEDVLDVINVGLDYVIMANPNNPTGALIDETVIYKILDKCLKYNIRLILDECFIELSTGKSLIHEIYNYSNLVIINSFTKTYGIPGTRLGFMVTGDDEYLEDVYKHLPEWNVSTLAQKAGIACLEMDEYPGRAKECVIKGREQLEDALKSMGIKVYPSDADYVLFKDDKNWYDILLQKKILIRDCSNYRGLCEGYYRIAVKSAKDNELLLNEMRKSEETHEPDR
ncbi:MAG: aminotransferase class I/II-fold pyridoxal phosphate-dependent enzyme [Lachnospiraceae bacterium]|nr:aminotransferase class I/II-fold pyridoxal phosphate-dependent enzyme [Lachnospiraceae bacterium]